MFHEVIYDLLLTGLANPKDMSCLHVDDDCSILVSCVNHDLVDTENFAVSFRLLQFPVSSNILLCEPGFVDALDNVPPDAGDLGCIGQVESICQAILHHLL